jgi:hypothetical protein
VGGVQEVKDNKSDSFSLEVHMLFVCVLFLSAQPACLFLLLCLTVPGARVNENAFYVCVVRPFLCPLSSPPPHPPAPRAHLLLL